MGHLTKVFKAFDELFDRVDELFDEVFGDDPPPKPKIRRKKVSACSPCPWVPAKTSKGPARHCLFCSTTQQITEEEFYAQFGPRLFHVMKRKK